MSRRGNVRRPPTSRLDGRFEESTVLNSLTPSPEGTGAWCPSAAAAPQPVGWTIELSAKYCSAPATRLTTRTPITRSAGRGQLVGVTVIRDRYIKDARSTVTDRAVEIRRLSSSLQLACTGLCNRRIVGAEHQRTPRRTVESRSVELAPWEGRTKSAGVIRAYLSVVGDYTRRASVRPSMSLLERHMVGSND
jgi:hypothetical protein